MGLDLFDLLLSRGSLCAPSVEVLLGRELFLACCILPAFLKSCINGVSFPPRETVSFRVLSI
jgi:hypothetical protein